MPFMVVTRSSHSGVEILTTHSHYLSYSYLPSPLISNPRHPMVSTYISIIYKYMYICMYIIYICVCMYVCKYKIYIHIFVYINVSSKFTVFLPVVLDYRRGHPTPGGCWVSWRTLPMACPTAMDGWVLPAAS